jgi:hypothetical protein
MAKTIKVELNCDMTINNIYKLIHILERVKGIVYVKKENADNIANLSLIGIKSLNLHRFDNVEIYIETNSQDENYIANIIEREIMML